MPRPMSSTMLAALQSSSLQPAIFVEAYFATGPIRVWTGFGTISFNSHSWQGIGTLGSISVIEDGATVEAKGITISLSGIDPTLLADVLSEFQLGAAVTIYLGMFSSGSLISSPLVAWAGRMDQPTIDVAAESAIISINCESRLLDMNISVFRRYTNEDQQIDHPGDRGFEFVPSLSERIVYWGRVPSNTNNVS